MTNLTLIAHLNKHPDHMAKLRAWDRTTAPWVAFTGTWWSAYDAAQLLAAAEYFDLIAATRAEQIRCAKFITSGHPDQRGAALGLFDQMSEELIIEGKI